MKRTHTLDVISRALSVIRESDGADEHAELIGELTDALGVLEGPRYVYVLFHETNSGHSDDSDGYIEAIYETEAEAEAARLEGLRKLRDEGASIWLDPDVLVEDQEENVHWEHDLIVHTHQVIQPAKES